jgi:HD superfamily phosphodiesterase
MVFRPRNYPILRKATNNHVKKNEISRVIVMYLKAKIVKKLVEFFGDDFRRIEHALSVLNHAERIAEGHSGWDYEVLIAACLLHDVGIKPSEEILGYNNGHTQEQYGPGEAEKLLREISFPEDKLKKVREIVGNHHSKSKYEYPELAILKDADALVNRLESKETDVGQ